MQPAEYSSLAVAVIALAVGVHEAWRARRHDRLSVQPLLEVEKYFATDWSGLSVKNVGLGPAIVRSFTVRVDGNVVAGWQEAGEKLGIPFYFEFAWLHRNHALAQNAVVYLMRLFENENTDTNRTALDAAIRRISLDVDYESMYGQRMRPLTWPG